MPTLILVLVYWIHLLATVIWMGGLVVLVLAAWPGLGGAPGDKATPPYRVFEMLEQRVRPFANVSLGMLLVTGMIQMGADPHYEGFLQIANMWSAGMLLKHVAVSGVIIVGVVLQWSVQPALARTALLAGRRGEVESAVDQALWRRLRSLTAFSVGLGMLVLLCTAIVTAL